MISKFCLKQKKSLGVNDLLWGVNWGEFGGLHAMGGILGPPEMGVVWEL